MCMDLLTRFTLVAALSAGASTGQAQLNVPMPSGTTVSAAPATGPSLEETTKWITDKLVSTPSFRYKFGDLAKVSALFDGCDMLLTTENLNEGTAHINFMRLQDLDPVGVKAAALRNEPDYAIVKLRARDDKPLITYDATSTKPYRGSEVPSDYTPPPQSSLEGMERLKAGKKAKWGFGASSGPGPNMVRSTSFSLPFSEFAAAQALESAFRTAIELCTVKAQREGTTQQ